MKQSARSRLVGLGSLWGLVVAAPPAFVMADPFRPTFLLVAAVCCAVCSGALGTLVAGRRVMKKDRGWPWPISGFGIGAWQGLFGGVVGAFLIWVLMAATISGFSLGDAFAPSVLTSPRVLLGSFFVSLSAFVYALVVGLVLGPLFGPLVGRTARGDVAGDVRPKAAGEARGKEGTFVR